MGERVIHTEVAEGDPVTDDDSSEMSPSPSDAGHVDDISRDVPTVRSPDAFPVQGEEGEVHELSRVRR